QFDGAVRRRLAHQRFALFGARNEHILAGRFFVHGAVILHDPAIGTGDVGQFADRPATAPAAILADLGPRYAVGAADMVTAELGHGPRLGPEVRGTRPAFPAPAECLALVWRNADMGGDPVRRVPRRHTATEDGGEIGHLRFAPRIDR